MPWLLISRQIHTIATKSIVQDWTQPRFCAHHGGMRQEHEHQRHQQAAKDHLWMHFTRHGSYDHADVPIITRGEGSYI